ncbi:ATP-binding cassette domain-containing protein, partial [Shigella flexneri]|nr:ATP-binding cassette domain-containing protein [Shigella flexneri]
MCCLLAATIRAKQTTNCSFTLSQGTICCLLGANGCGKTT